MYDVIIRNGEVIDGTGTTRFRADVAIKDGRIDRPLGIYLGLSVGHSAIRRVVMGVDSTKRESTPEELEKMKQLLRDGLGAGALGFTSSYARTHNDAEGHMVPSRYANTSEL